MAGAAIGALAAAMLGSLAPDWALLCVCAALVPIVIMLFLRRSAFFLLPLAAFLVLVRIALLPTAMPSEGAIPTFIGNLRASLRGNADALFSDEAGAARGILLGDTAALEASQRAAFAASGLLHLFAVSGLHVAVLVGVFGRLVRTSSKALSFAVLALFLLFLCAVTGFTPSVLRASFLLVGLRLCRMRERKADMPSVFCFSMAMTLLCEPFAFKTAGWFCFPERSENPFRSLFGIRASCPRCRAQRPPRSACCRSWRCISVRLRGFRSRCRSC